MWYHWGVLFWPGDCISRQKYCESIVIQVRDLPSAISASPESYAIPIRWVNWAVQEIPRKMWDIIEKNCQLQPLCCINENASKYLL